MDLIETDEGTYLEFSNLDEANKSMFNALRLLKRTMNYLPITLSDEVVDFLSDNGWPDEEYKAPADATPTQREGYKTIHPNYLPYSCKIKGCKNKKRNGRCSLDLIQINITETHCLMEAPAQDDANQVEKDAEGFRKYLGR